MNSIREGCGGAAARHCRAVVPSAPPHEGYQPPPRGTTFGFAREPAWRPSLTQGLAQVNGLFRHRLEVIL